MTSTETSAKSSFRNRDDIHVLAAILAVTAWGIGPIFNKALSVSTSSIVFYRMLFGLPIMVVMAYMNGGSLNKHVIRKAALPGFMFAMSFITGFATVKMTSIANATMVGTLQPVLVLFVAVRMNADSDYDSTKQNDHEGYSDPHADCSSFSPTVAQIHAHEI